MSGSSSPPVIPDHTLIRMIGHGSYGEVWLACDAFGAFRAVKVTHQSLFRDRRPFERELKGVQTFEPVSRLHPGLMNILRVGHNLEAGFFYSVMELADDVETGQSINPGSYKPRTLSSDLARLKRLPVDECLKIGIAIGSALAFLHQRNLIHRDVKPSNVVFVNGVPKLGDVGLVAETSEALSYVGTEGFIPPEGPGTVKADIYSLGKVLYEISTGKDRHDYPQLPTMVDQADPLLLELNRVVLKACRIDPRERYRSATDFVSDLQAVAQGGRIKPEKSPVLRIAIVLLIGLGGVCAFFFLKSSESSTPSAEPVDPELRASVPAPVGAFPAPSGMVAWLRGEGPGGNDALNPPGEIKLHRVALAEGKVGRAYSVSRGKGFVEVPDSPALRLTNEMTVEFWLKRSQFEHSDFILEKGGDWTGGVLNYGVSVNGREDSDGSLVFLFACGWRGAGSILDTEWHHCAIVARDGEADPHVYIDGIQRPVHRRGGSAVITLYPSSAPLHVGAQVDPATGYNYFSDKTIDEVTIYNRALTPEEIGLLACSGNSGKFTEACMPLPENSVGAMSPHSIGPPGLICWWRGEGNALDSVGIHHGQEIGAVGFAPGVEGAAFLLNGTNSYIRVTHKDSLNLTNGFSLGLWVKDQSSFRYIYGLIAKRGSEAGPTLFDLTVIPRGAAILYNDPTVRAGDDPMSDFEVVSSGFWPEPHLWCHLFGTFRPDGPDHIELSLFVNGTLVRSGHLPGSLARAISTAPVTLGVNAEYPNYEYFEGLMDDIRIYNRPLSKEEVASVYQLCADELKNLEGAVNSAAK